MMCDDALHVLTGREIANKLTWLYCDDRKIRRKETMKEKKEICANVQDVFTNGELTASSYGFVMGEEKIDKIKRKVKK